MDSSLRMDGLNPIPTSGAVPDVLAMGRRFLPDAPESRIVKRLHELLTNLERNVATWELEAQIEWLEQLSDWLHRRGWPASRNTTSIDLLAMNDPRTLHLELLVRVLSGIDAWRQAFAKLVRGVLSQMQATLVFSDVGLPQEPGFWREAAARFSESILPRPPNLRLLSELLARILPAVEDARWLLRVPRALFEQFLTLLHDGERRGDWSGLRRSIFEAVTVLSVRICALGLANDVRERLPEMTLDELPFLRLQRVCEGLLSRAALPASSVSGNPLGGSGGSGNIVEAFVFIQDCRQAVQQVLSHLEDYGVSVDLVYRLELINAMLGRLEELLGLLFSRQAHGSAHEAGHFIAELILSRVQRRSIRALFQQSTHQLARKIVERTGKSGEKYISETPSEWRHILWAGTGAGVLTLGTAVLKFFFSAWKLPAFFAGFVASLNYSLSFVIIQLCHFTLATKQPSMTAAALASAIRGRVEEDDLERLVDMIQRITRSQVAAALGNVGAVIPAAIAFDVFWRWRTGHSFLTEHDAEHTIESLQPLRSLPFAALTGIYLWLASVAAGWLENWAVYNHLPEAVAGSRRLRRLFGRRITSWLGRAISYHTSGIGGVVALGFFLGMSPVIGQFFGIPSEVRHVTLSSGALALAGSHTVATLGGKALLSHHFVFAGIGIVLILILNFGVSFAMAMWVALRARNVQRKDYMALLRTMLRRFVKSPLAFFVPRGQKTVSSVAMTPPSH